MANFVKLQHCTGSDGTTSVHSILDADSISYALTAAATLTVSYTRADNTMKTIVFTVGGATNTISPYTTEALEKDKNVQRLEAWLFGMSTGRGISSKMAKYSHMGMIKAAGLTKAGLPGVAESLVSVVIAA